MCDQYTNSAAELPDPALNSIDETAHAYIAQLEPSSLVRQFINNPPRGFHPEWLAGGVCAFTAPFDILTTVEPTTRKRIERWIGYSYWQRWLQPNARFIGSTVTEYALFPSASDPTELAHDLRRSQSRSCPLLIIKDIPQSSPLIDASDNAWADIFVQSCVDIGFILLDGQALAWVPIDFPSIDQYLSRLSRARRRNIRRKLRSRVGLEIQTTPTGTAFADDAIIDCFHALYCNVYAQSDVHFDFLGRELLASMLRDGGNGGVVFVYRHAGQMIGWNLCFEYGTALVDKYIGLSYPQARDHNLYAVSWMHNLEYARERGLLYFIAGWTDAQAKVDLGAKLTFTRHAVYPQNWFVRLALRVLARYFESDRVLSQDTQNVTSDP